MALNLVDLIKDQFSEQALTQAGMLDQLPGGARESASTAARNGLGQLMPVIDKVLAIPGVGPGLRPAAERMQEKLAILSSWFAAYDSPCPRDPPCGQQIDYSVDLLLTAHVYSYAAFK